MTDWSLFVETYLHIAAIVLYALAAAAIVFGAIMDNSWLRKAGGLLVLVGLALHTAALGFRWYGTGHGPYLTRYEVMSSNAWMTIVVFQLLSWRRKSARVLAPIVYPVVLFLLAIGVYTGAEVKTLPPTFAGIWLMLHIGFYFVAFSAALLSLSFSAMYVGYDVPFVRGLPNLPDRETLDRESYRFAGLTFAFWGIGMLAGSIWAYYSWGRYWGWDPVETWSLITWFVYGIYLHMRRFFGLKGSRAALLLLVGFTLAVGSLFFTSLLTNSLHAEYFK